jgi:hypothetical protein
VTVVNLVCEQSIEHGIMFLLAQKQALADGLLDGQGDIATLKMPSGRASMIERIQAMMEAGEAAPARIVTPDEAVAEELRERYGERVLLVEVRGGSDGRLRMLAVLDLDREALETEQRRLGSRGEEVVVEAIDRATFLTMRRLQASGMLQQADGPLRVLHRSAELAEPDQSASQAEARTAELRRQAERSLRMATVLASDGFPEEAPSLIAKALGLAGAATLSALGELAPGTSMATPAQCRSWWAGARCRAADHCDGWGAVVGSARARRRRRRSPAR